MTNDPLHPPASPASSSRELTLEFSGTSRELIYYDDEGCPIETRRQVKVDYFRDITVDGRKYRYIDFAEPDNLDIDPEILNGIEDFDIATLGRNLNAASAELLTSNDVAVTTVVTLPAGEEFDPAKAAFVTGLWTYPDANDEMMIICFAYGSQTYQIDIHISKTDYREEVWNRNDDIYIS